jgi:hypothetical protein
MKVEYPNDSPLANALFRHIEEYYNDKTKETPPEDDRQDTYVDPSGAGKSVDE